MTKPTTHWKHKSVGMSIKIKNTPKNRAFVKLMETAQKCTEAQLDYLMYNAATQDGHRTYRKYRRGADRCKRCGLRYSRGHKR